MFPEPSALTIPVIAPTTGSVSVKLVAVMFKLLTKVWSTLVSIAEFTLAVVWYKLVVPSVTSSVSPLNSLSASLLCTCASTYAFTDSADGTLVALAPAIVSESTIAFCTLASALASV